jgi:Icc-related predicted phosphoesterase
MGINFYGCPWTPAFCNWSFMYDRGSSQARKIWDQVPMDTHVLVSHGPPSGIGLSWAKDWKSESAVDVGCGVLKERITELPCLKASFHGHLHSGYGSGTVGDTHCMNVSVMNESYDVVRNGLVFRYS